MRRNKRLVIIIIVLLIIAGTLFAWARLGTDGPLQTYKNTDVACLAGHQNVKHHIHPNLVVTVEGTKQSLPAQVGIEPGCMAEVHTHARGSKLHVETTAPERLGELTLADFFSVWEKSYERDGYEQTLTIDGEEMSGPEEITFEGTDGATIRIDYIRERGTSTATTSTVSAATTTATSSHSHPEDTPEEHSHE